MNDFNLERGNMSNLAGNAFVYWEISSRQNEAVKTKIVVTNFIVSPLQFEKNTIAATFPPIVFEQRETLFALAEKADVDIIRMSHIQIPEDGFDFSSFFKQQLGHFNRVVTDYSRVYSENISSFMDGIEPEKLSERENLEHIKELAIEAREAYVRHRNKKMATDMIIQLRRISHVLNKPVPKYDIEDLIGLLEIQDERVDEVSSLYFKKFFAIYTEQYEQAEELKKEIQQIKKRLTL